MAAVCLHPAVRSGWRAACRAGSLGPVRRRCSAPWYQEHLEVEEKGYRSPSRIREERFSILKNPGVTTVEKLNKELLCDLLAQNVVYKEGPLVAINKPQGLPITGSPEGLSLVSVLPELQQILQMKSELHVVKASPKESSGLVLLSTCHVTTKEFEDFYAKCRKLERPFATFCAITLGTPSPAKGEIKVALKIENIGGLELVVPVMHPSKGSLERREVKRTETWYKVLHSVEGCSLLQLQPMSVHRDQLSVHCTLKFCPILGDHTYSSRVSTILGENIYVPVDLAIPKTQRIDEKILRKMHITEPQMHRIPLHLHFQHLLMPDSLSRRYPTHLTAPPPPFFKRTMELLHLKIKKPVLIEH
ncbi:mitochondrial mRNA pseudouridine synthase RPUSD3 [Hyla sarda]|uniref:mitochondrial mRNA pseudouridine synthase RPUSD3 n=1 Tax=Hyla sarda TaxID=327740 RepID=UPI0024C3D3DC|nr:mitochondrial mRNA pseudouridine synthase RPUSD3 [Hyla sarda]